MACCSGVRKIKLLGITYGPGSIGRLLLPVHTASFQPQKYVFFFIHRGLWLVRPHVVAALAGLMRFSLLQLVQAAGEAGRCFDTRLRAAGSGRATGRSRITFVCLFFFTSKF